MGGGGYLGTSQDPNISTQTAQNCTASSTHVHQYTRENLRKNSANNKQFCASENLQKHTKNCKGNSKISHSHIATSNNEAIFRRGKNLKSIYKTKSNKVSISKLILSVLFLFSILLYSSIFLFSTPLVTLKYNVNGAPEPVEGSGDETLTNTSGTCGDGVTYTFDTSSGLLTISKTGSGTGELDGTERFNDYKNIKKVIIEDGVKGNALWEAHQKCFTYCYYLEEVWLGKDIGGLYQWFYSCDKLNKLVVTDPDVSLEYTNFTRFLAYCGNVDVYGYPGSTIETWVTQLKNGDFMTYGGCSPTFIALETKPELKASGTVDCENGALFLTIVESAGAYVGEVTFVTGQSGAIGTISLVANTTYTILVTKPFGSSLTVSGVTQLSPTKYTFTTGTGTTTATFTLSGSGDWKNTVIV